MASSNLELDRPGGRVNVETGQLLSESDIDRIGSMSLQSILALLSLLFFDDELGVPLSGFPRDQLGTDHCIVSATGDLSYSVSTGWGFIFDATFTTQEFGQNRYRPIVLATASTGSLGAHHATLPRIDRVCIAPITVDDQSAARNVKNPSTGVVSSTSVDQRQRFSATVLVVAGTPNASPTAPATPAGYIAIGEALVPATSGAATWSDIRPVLELGHYFRGLPRHATGNYVPLGGSNELLVTATSPASMNLFVTMGRAVINGISRFYRAAVYPPLTVGAAHATLVRYDLVVARQNGTLDIVAGTAGLGVPPAVPSNAAPLAMVTVAATVTQINAGDLTDLRDREPFIGSTHLQARSVGHDRLNRQTVKLALSASAVVSDVSTLTITATYPDGTALPSTALGAAGEGEAFACVAEFFRLDQDDHNSTSGYFGYAGVVAVRNIRQPEDPNDDAEESVVLSADGTNATPLHDDGAVVFSPRMYFAITDPAEVATIFLRRYDAPLVGKYLVHVYPISAPGSGARVTVTFA